jgi:hypothetical protein
MAQIQYLDCCGIKEFAQIQTFFQSGESVKKDARSALEWFFKQYVTQETKSIPSERGLFVRAHLPARNPVCATLYGKPQFVPRMAHVVFSDNNIRGFKFGEPFADLLTAEGLGTVTVIPEAKNPNTSNVISMFVWTINVKACQKWVEKHCLHNDGFQPEGLLVDTAHGVTAEYCDKFDEFFQAALPECKKTYTTEYDARYYAVRKVFSDMKDPAIIDAEAKRITKINAVWKAKSEADKNSKPVKEKA